MMARADCPQIARIDAMGAPQVRGTVIRMCCPMTSSNLDGVRDDACAGMAGGGGVLRCGAARRTRLKRRNRSLGSYPRRGLQWLPSGPRRVSRWLDSSGNQRRVG